MKTLEEISDILSLKRRGYSERGVTRKLGIHRKTVKKYLESPDWMHSGTNRKKRERSYW